MLNFMYFVFGKTTDQFLICLRQRRKKEGTKYRHRVFAPLHIQVKFLLPRLPSVLKDVIAPLISLITQKINGSDTGGPQALASCPWLALGITCFRSCSVYTSTTHMGRHPIHLPSFQTQSLQDQLTGLGLHLSSAVKVQCKSMARLLELQDTLTLIRVTLTHK